MEKVLFELNIPTAFINNENEIEYIMWIIDVSKVSESTITKKMYISFNGSGYSIRETFLYYNPTFDHTTEILDGFEGGLELQDVKDIISSL